MTEERDLWLRSVGLSYALLSDTTKLSMSESNWFERTEQMRNSPVTFSGNRLSDRRCKGGVPRYVRF